MNLHVQQTPNPPAQLPELEPPKAVGNRQVDSFKDNYKELELTHPFGCILELRIRYVVESGLTNLFKTVMFPYLCNMFR